MTEWYKLSLTDVLNSLAASAEGGLSAEEAQRRLEQFGPNELIERGVKSPWMILLEQFTQTMVVVLIIATIISAALGEWKDAAVVLGIVVINALLGFRQEYQAERAMAALKRLAVPTVRVRREGHVQEISARELVPGDLVLLEAGTLVPADCRLLESVNLQTQEAPLTGESQPVDKDARYMPPLNEKGEPADQPLAERHNMVYMGTIVSYGRALAVVAETGMRTQLGGIAELMQAAGQEPTPLQRRLAQLGRGLALAALVLVIIVFLLGLLRGEDVKLLFMTSISIAVAAIPEGLPAVVTIALALGAQRMLKRNALIRKLPAVEGLGSVTVICSDKTGTLTENRMTVVVLDVAHHRLDLTSEEQRLPFVSRVTPCAEDQPPLEALGELQSAPTLALMLLAGALCNDAILECEQESSGFRVVGDPTEGALLVAAAQVGLLKAELDAAFPRLAEAPFDSERKRMTTVHQLPMTQNALPGLLAHLENRIHWLDLRQMNYAAFTKGAVDLLLKICTRVWAHDHIEPLDEHWRARIEAANRELAQQGMRVLGVACRGVSEEELHPAAPGDPAERFERELIFVGLVGMIDPARPEVKDAVQTCRTAGIRPIMITGDHPLTAGYIARELQIINEKGEVITGHEMDSMSASELETTIQRASVFARVTPEHKLRIVEALQNNHQIVAMTGDGVNDAPALKKADIGVAMGITGTDVSKEASDMVLLDDNFATIVAAVREGRIIYDNIRRFIQYTLTSNTAEILVVLLAPFLGLPLPLLPIQILWINLVTDGLPGLALGVEIGERNVMRRPPYPPKENVFGRGLGVNLLWIGSLMGLLSIVLGFAYWRMGSPYWQTMIFSTITLSEMGYVMAIRSNRDSLFSIGLLSNRALLYAVLGTTLLQIAVIYVPFLQNLLYTQALPLRDLLICLLVGSSLFWVVEFQKWILRKRNGD